MVRVEALFVYPIKSCRAVAVERARVERRGLEHDRRFMVVDLDGTFVSQRTDPQLATVEATIDGDALTISAVGAGSVRVTQGSIENTRRAVRVHESYRSSAWFAGRAAADLLSAIVGRAVELVAMPRDEERRLPARWGFTDGLVSYADAFPLLLTACASLDDLAGRASSSIEMARFRPNVVVSGSLAYEEDVWSKLRIGEVELAAPKLCDRCVVTTTDQTTGERGLEPLRTLATYRRWDGAVWFGTNLVPLAEGHIAVGDEVIALATRSQPPTSNAASSAK